MIKNPFNISAMSAALILAGPVLGLGTASYAEEPGDTQKLEQTEIDYTKIATEISNVLAEVEGLTGEAASDKFDELDNLIPLEDDEALKVLTHPEVAKSIFYGAIPLLQHSDYSVRFGAVFLIGGVGLSNPGCAGNAALLLEGMKNDPDKWVREWSQGIIEGLREEYGMEVLMHNQQCALTGP